jgi:2-octaprenyl-6-methoxyphenol hydroxylase
MISPLSAAVWPARSPPSPQPPKDGVSLSLRRRAARARMAAPPHLLSESLDLLSSLGVWDTVRPSSAPLRTMRILDGTSRLFRAPPVSFHSSEIDLDAFGYNIPNQPLFDALHAAAASESRIDRFEALSPSAEHIEDDIVLYLDDGTEIRAAAALAADGRNSTLRDAIGIRSRHGPIHNQRW